MVVGPIQVFLIGFDDIQASGRIMSELYQIRRLGLIRLVDALFVEKGLDGAVRSSMHLTDLSEEERTQLGAVAGAIFGLAAGGSARALIDADAAAAAVAERDYGLSSDELRDLADEIPPGGAAALLVVEHQWAAGLRDSLVDAGGFLLAQAMVGPDLVATMGAELAAQIEAAEAIAASRTVQAEAGVLAADALIQAGLIEAEAADEAARTVATAVAIEDEAARDAAAAVEAAEDVKAQAALSAYRALLDAEVIEEEAADDAMRALVAAGLIEEEAADEAGAAVRAARAVEDEAIDEAAATVRAAEAVEDEAMEEAAIVLDDLTVIAGIGPVHAEALREAGITSLLDLVSAEAAVVASVASVSEDHAAQSALEASGLID